MHLALLLLYANLVSAALRPTATASSFADFVRHLKMASDAQSYVGKPGCQVRDRAAFEEMRNYLLNLYEGVHAKKSFVSGTQVVDCIPLQNSLRCEADRQDPAEANL